MRVIYLTDSIGNKQNGGSGLSGLRFLQLLMARYGHVHVVTDAVRNVPEAGEGYSVTAVQREAPSFGMSVRAMIRAIGIRVLNLPRPAVATIDAGGDDALIVCNSFSALPARIRVRNARTTRSICVVRGDTNSFDFQGFGGQVDADPLREPLAFLESFDGLVFVSSTTQKNWKALIRKPQRHYLLPNAIDEREVNALLGQPRDGARASLGWKADDLHLVVVGSLQRRKGQDVFVGAAPALLAALPNVYVHFVGVVSPPFGGIEMAQSLQQAGGDRYIVHGHREDALTLVHAGDVAVCVSHSEAFPRSVAEYMALGKAIVTTPVAGADEMVIDGQTGVLVPPADAEALTRTLVAIARDPARREALGNAARARYLAEYSIPMQTQRFGEIFTDFDAAPAPSRSTPANAR
jgi:glycosyltransferase involved in cell wall biosynthesis